MIDPQVRNLMGMVSAMLDVLDRMGMFDPVPGCRCGCPLREHIPVKHGDGPWMTVCRNCSPCRQYRDKTEEVAT